jgi:hypothetical protein
MATRERAAKKVETTSNVVEMKKTRTRAVEKDEAPAKRTRAAEKTEAPAKKAAFGGKVPRAMFSVPKRRKAPVDNNNDAVALLVTAALNANPESEGVSAGKLNLLLMGAGLASSSAEAVVLVTAAQKAGVIVGE